MSEELVEIHPFAHLGPAPYRFVSVWVMPSKSLAGENPDAWNNALRSAPCAVGSCHHCSAGLTDHYIIADADGTLHAVGSSCVKKISKGSKKITRLEFDVREAKRARDREKRHAREAKQGEELAAIMSDPATKAALSALPHPRGFEDRETGEPLSAWDFAEFMLRCSGASGQGKLLRFIKQVI